MKHGHSWSIFVDEPDGTTTASCSQCHGSLSTDGAREQITAWQDSFEALHGTVAGDVERAVEAMNGVDDAGLQATLEAATADLVLAEGDESGGFHNHDYLMALLEDAGEKAREILTETG